MDHPHIEARKSPLGGKGVFATKRIRKGEIVTEFDGEEYTEELEDWPRDLLYHTIQTSQGTWRDSAGIVRLLNHSCNPNCGITNYTQLVAMRTIQPGEEITWDYEMTEDSDWFRMKCKCGHEDCRRVIGSFARMPEKFRKKYQGYISEWLVEKYGLPPKVKSNKTKKPVKKF